MLCLLSIYNNKNLRSSIAHVTIFNSSTTWAATFRLRGYKSSACWLFSCFHNPPNSDMDYRIFNIIYNMVFHMRTYRGWAHRQWVGTTFLTWKNSAFFLCSWWGFEPSTLGSPVQHSNHWANLSPPSCQCQSLVKRLWLVIRWVVFHPELKMKRLTVR